MRVPSDRIADYAAAAGRQSAVGGNDSARWNVGPRSVRSGLHPAGIADGESDDVYGRTKIYEAIVKGEAAIEPGRS